MRIKTLISSHPIVRLMDGNWEVMRILLGTFYIALLAQVEIPLVPVPVTLQTFAIFSLALFQGSKRSACSLLLYLVAATLGLPVFPGAYSNSCWMLVPTAGYCLSFPLAAYICGKCSELKNSFSFRWMILGLCCAQLVVYVMGVSWLSFSVGWKQAFIGGLLPFVLFDLLKLWAAASIKMAVVCFDYHKNQ